MIERWWAVILVGWGIWLMCGLPPFGWLYDRWRDRRVPDYVPEEWVDRWGTK